jgi:hypothetical protein
VGRSKRVIASIAAIGAIDAIDEPLRMPQERCSLQGGVHR